MSDLSLRVHALSIYPVKSCAGIALAQARLTATGLEHDRAWMLVDAQGRFASQRQWPRLQLIRPSFEGDTLLLHAPDMLPLAVPLQVQGTPRPVRVWDDELTGLDQGDAAAHWFEAAIGQPLRLVRFDPAQRRLSDAKWSAGVDAENAFSDGFPLLVASTASLAELNARLAARGQPPVTMERFRPNLVLDGLEDAHGEDFIDTLALDGGVRLKLVKPCVRCSIPNVDPVSAEPGDEPGATLATYRADPRMKGGLTFAMNAVIEAGVGATLRVGGAVEATLAV
ncbi:MOSC domain-containing protein [Azohydromonas caseinilytica]|uniref:MOSC domain-containing protein n=1 Tax=Azohydromonas caseinilytica TaxID=2728836 RepID=UPI0028739D7F|nr:MOSC N-terminal beta barrel domain-containing protein [Azohydromonas caseinilytica]